MLKLSIYALTFLPLAQAWTFLYTNATSNATILHESDITNCTKIDLAKGKEFSWDPEGADLCISIYYDDSCTSRGGLSCGAWKKDSGNDYHGIEIFKNDESSSTSVSPSPTPTPTTFSSTAASPTSTTTVFPTGDTNTSSSKQDSGSSLSGGEIAGIVIGVVAALAIICLLLFYFLRRKSQASTRPPSSIRSSHKPTLSDMQSAMPPHEFAFASYEKTPPPSRGRPAPGAKLVELPGGNQTVELENSPVSGDGDSSGFRLNRF